MKDDLFHEIYQSIVAQLEQRVHLIGNRIVKDAMELAESENIRDRGDFIDSINYIVRSLPDGFLLNVGSRVRHAQYVLGGKVPSWTPIAPLISWVERKGISWVDRKTGKLLSVEQMAYAIRGKIKREGIPARNIFKTVINELDSWITEQIDSIKVPDGASIKVQDA